MSRIKANDTHKANGFFKYESNGRHGYRVNVSARKFVEHWSNHSTDAKQSATGDLWVSTSLLTEKVRDLITEAHGVISDSPWSPAEKKVVLSENDTHENRVALFKKICEAVGA